MVCFKSEVSGVIETHLGARNVALERFCSWGQKERIAVAPYREQRRPFRAEIFLELRIEREVGGIVQEEVELDLVIAGPSQQGRSRAGTLPAPPGFRL